MLSYISLTLPLHGRSYGGPQQLMVLQPREERIFLCLGSLNLWSEFSQVLFLSYLPFWKFLLDSFF